MDPPDRQERLRFGPFVLDTRRVELTRNGVVVPLRPKPFALLATLARHPGTVLSKEALLAAVWPGLVVSDDSLTQAVHDLRTALGDAGTTLVHTVARHGYRFDAEVVDPDVLPAHAPMAAASPAAAVSSAARGAVVGPVLVAVALAVAVPIVGGVIGGWSPDEATVRDEQPAHQTLPFNPPRQSVVVLPLEVELGSEGGSGFGDPLSADLATDLGRYLGIVVISPESAFSYKGRQVDPRQVARELNVRYVVRGAVRRRGNDVRLALALIDGATGRQSWAEQFTLDRANLRASLEDVTGVVSRALGVQVLRAEGRRATSLAPAQVEADDLAMMGWAVWFRGLSRENTLEALRLFEAAAARDPDSLRAWAGIGYLNGQARSLGWAADPAAALGRQREALRQVERIDRDDMVAYMARVGPYYWKADYEGLLRFTHILVERFPNHPWSHHQQAMAFLKLGRFDECVAPSLKAAQLGPRDSALANWRTVLAFCHFFAKRYMEAANEARLAGQASSVVAGPQMMLAAALARHGQVDEARKLVREYAGQADFRADKMRTVLAGDEPRLVEGRERLMATLKELGVQ